MSTWATATLHRTSLIGPLSQALPVPPDLKRGSHTKALSPPSPPLKPSYSQIVKTKIPPRDLEKQARDPGKVTRDSSCDRCAVSAVDCFPCHAPKKEGAHYFGTAVKNLSNIRTQTNKKILE